MSHVEIDNFDCPCCKKTTNAELNIKLQKYICMNCGREFE